MGNKLKSNIEIKYPSRKVSLRNLSKKNIQELVIKRGSKRPKREYRLSDVLKFIPNGFVYKDETGMGATTLELISPRNSIIVEPLKITAYSKAKKDNAFYVGSPLLSGEAFVTTDKIISYLKKDTPEYKKIIVVADSLKKVIEALNKVKNKDFFLLIDE